MDNQGNSDDAIRSTPAPALTEATMDKMTVEQIEQCRSLLAALTVDASKPPGQFLMKQPEWTNRVNALCDLAKIALTPPQDVAGLVEELAGWIADCTVSEVDGDAIEPVRKARDAILSLSARNRGLEAENGNLKSAVEELDEQCEQLTEECERLRAEKAEAEVSRLTNLAQEGRKAGMEEAIRWHQSEAKMYWGVWENAQNMEHQEARFDAQFHDKAAEKLRALIPQEPGENGK